MISPVASAAGHKGCSCGRLLYIWGILQAIVYVDGLNLYYNLVKGTSYKWLDLDALCNTLLPQHSVVAIKYFTAIVKPRPHDAQAHVRQNIYIRALETIPKIEVIRGRFISKPKPFPYHPWSYPYPNFMKSPFLRVPVVKEEEKQSDVNLATHLLVDCFKNNFDIGVVISNDADLKLPLEMVVKEFGKKIGVVNPQRRNWKYVHQDLAKWATFTIDKINTSALKKCQFAPQLTDSKGVFTKPQGW